LTDELALLLGQRGVEVKHEWVSINAEFSHDEWHPMSHEAGNEVNVSREPIKFGHDDRAAKLFCLCECRCKLRASIEGIAALARFDFLEGTQQGAALCLDEAQDGGLLCLYAKP
jgi:hypothetical protein